MTHAKRIVVSGTTLILCPELAKHLGKSAALVLQQVHYWLSQQNKNYGIIEDGVQWIRNSYRQWQEQLPHLSLTTIRRTFTFLEEKHIIQSKTVEGNKYYPGGDQVKYFTINYDALENSIGSLSAIRIHRPGCHIISENRTDNVRAGESAYNTSHSSAPLSKMDTPPVQNGHPLIYITKTTSENFSTIGESATASIPTTGSDRQHRQAEREIINFDKKLENIPLGTAEAMIRLWNEIIEAPTTMISLTPQRSRYLTTAFKQYFKADLACWEFFCLKIASSKFLMGEVTSFKAHLDWALRFSTMQRILEGAYSFGDRFVSRLHSSPLQLETTEANPATPYTEPKTILIGPQPSASEDQVLSDAQRNEDQLRAKLQNDVGEALYRSWFKQTHILFNQDVTCEQGEGQGALKFTPYLIVSSSFVKQRLKTQFSDVIELYFSDVLLENEASFLNHAKTGSQNRSITTAPHNDNPILVKLEEECVHEKTAAPQTMQILERPSVVSCADNPVEMKIDDVVLERDVSNVVDTEYDYSLFTRESEPRQDLMPLDESGLFIPNTSVKPLHWLKPDFPFKRRVFQEGRDITHPVPFDPPDVTPIPMSLCQRKHVYLEGYVLSSGHDHQTPLIFVSSRKNFGCLSALISCVDRTQHDPPHSSNTVY